MCTEVMIKLINMIGITNLNFNNLSIQIRVKISCKAIFMKVPYQIKSYHIKRRLYIGRQFCIDTLDDKTDFNPLLFVDFHILSTQISTFLDQVTKI